LGGVGLAAVMGARLAGATRILAVDRSAAKAELALAVGATSFSPPEQASEKDFDAVLEATGTVEGFELALELTRRGGRTVSVSLPDAQQRFSFPLARLVAEARTVAGSYIGSCLPSCDIPAFISLYRQGRLPVERLVTRTIALEQINEALDALAEARVVRQVVAF
jgi:alcohol dehydrogenase